ncbi:MAG: 1,5-anhydro-D-fructose reductase [Planctomycetes bacterium ADurb.Bin126]|nr:MAG: 1,5-anhydro-D-fructose reductase [Planctomycetes bacterium ADurb.Bin126]HOD81934.1 Gfo/Idh/MocA family oxidoreductase [Phycisphaerae bacterium]HQL74149.1 Gfo/Idh/MocA family oxidoreductase [Phycisphaerae bacterium]
MAEKTGPTRRQFLAGASAAAATAFAANFPQVARGKVIGANDRIGVGYIGCGGRSHSHMHSVHYLKDQKKENIALVAFNDVYKPRLDRCAAAWKGKPYRDYRELLADPNVDLVCISTPDHHHPYAVADAAKAGKDIYCEKPFTHWRQFEQLKMAVKAVKDAKVVFQLGTQGMSDGAWHEARKLILQGVIGKPIHAECGMFRDSDGGERGMPIDDRNAKPGPDLDWEQFQGDAPKKEFTVKRFFQWRLYNDYSGGPVTDVYPHCFTPVAYMMDAGFPQYVMAAGGIHRWPERDVPDSFNVYADYARKMTCCILGTFASGYNGGDGCRGSGARSPVVRGYDGALIFKGKQIEFVPNHGKKAAAFPIPYGENQVDHWAKLIACCRQRDLNTFSPIQLAYEVQTTMIMAYWSWKDRKVARFDPQTEQIVMG